ncbi:MAG: iron-sulfur cluster repair di-iron protein [Gammaproteobacteria bacterium]|nr:iron-sulfur cluster repair di-iron protein [Gammaproteobacteria bacterium]MDP6734737.1 iron-sulfur cluster repair di-iron protein [Gammaproteobacteria bacterium]
MNQRTGESSQSKINIRADTTLGNLVTEYPSLAREFERRGFDYCCNGHQTIADACRAQGLDPEAIVVEIAGTTTDQQTEPWGRMDVSALVDHLEATHHSYLRHELPRLSSLIEKIEAVHGDRHPELAEVARCYQELRADLEPHLLKEEQILFPMIRELAASVTAPEFHCGSLQNPITVMMAEHQRAGHLLGQLSELTERYQPPDDACNSYRACFSGLAELDADTRFHIHKENNVLFTAVVALEKKLFRQCGRP